MKRGFRTLLLIAMITGVFTTLAATEKFVARIVHPDSEDIEFLQKNEYDIAGGHPGEYIDVVVTESQYARLSSRGFNIRVQKTGAEVIEDLTAGEGRPIAGYREYNDVLADLEQYEDDYPEICRLYDIGESWGKEYATAGHVYYNNFQHEIWALKVSDNPDDTEDEPAIYYMGAHHSREPISTEVCMAVLDHVLTNYGTDDEITNDVDNKEIWFIPIVNPNGVKIVLDQTDIWWRKNIRDNNNNHTFDSDYQSGTGDDGVDPNRNYGFTWGNVGSTDNPNGETYHGPNEFSEPETQAVRDLVASRHFVAGISYHSHGELVLVPYGYADNIYPPDADALMDLGVLVAENIDALGYGHYTPQYSYALYPTMGGTDDWAYGVYGIFGYTVELATEFIPSANQVPQICGDNVPGAMELLRRIDYNTITGHITDADTGQPIQAEIFIEGIDDTGEFRTPCTSDEAYGRYYRMVMPGAYNVTYSAYGYLSQTNIVGVSDGHVTTQDIALSTAPTTDFHVIVRDAQTFMPYQGAVVTLGNTPFDPITTDEYGEFTFEGIAIGTYPVSISAEGYGLALQTIDLEACNNRLFFLYGPHAIDDFENGIGNWDASGTWDMTTSQYHSDNHSLTDSPSGNYNNNYNANCLMTQSIDLSDAQMASCSFWAKYDIEAGYDFVYLQVRGGGTWENIAAISGQSDWTYLEYDLSDFLGYDEVDFRFRIVTDTYVDGDGIYIDDFAIFRDNEPTLTYGDVDDSDTITSDDAGYIHQYAAGLDPLESFDPRPWEDARTVAADVDENGLVTSYDAALVQQYVDGTIDEFPAEDADIELAQADIEIQLTTDYFIFQTDDELFGFDLVCWISDTVVPGQPEVLADDVETEEYIGDVIMGISLMSPEPFTGSFMRIPYTLPQETADTFTFQLDVNAQSIEYIVDMDTYGTQESPKFTDHLCGNYPNPFNPTTTIKFSLSKETPVEITIYNVRGQRVKKLVSEPFDAGVHTVTWDGKDDREQPVASGVYLYRYKAGNTTKTRKALMLK